MSGKLSLAVVGCVVSVVLVGCSAGSDASTGDAGSESSPSVTATPTAEESDLDAAARVMLAAWPEDPPPWDGVSARDLTEEQVNLSTWCYGALKEPDETLRQWLITTRSDLDVEGRLSEVPSKVLRKAARQVFDEKCPAYFEEDWESPW